MLVGEGLVLWFAFFCKKINRAHTLFYYFLFGMNSPVSGLALTTFPSTSTSAHQSSSLLLYIQYLFFPLCLRYVHLSLTKVASCFGHIFNYCPAIFSPPSDFPLWKRPSSYIFHLFTTYSLIQTEPSSTPVIQLKPHRGRISSSYLSSSLQWSSWLVPASP